MDKLSDVEKVEAIRQVLSHYQENKWKALFGFLSGQDIGMCFTFEKYANIPHFTRQIPEISAMMDIMYPRKLRCGYWFSKRNLFSRIKLLKKVETCLSAKLRYK